MNKKKISIGPKLYITLCFIFFYLPIAVTMFFSFNSSKSLTKFTGFSLKWYKKLLTDNDIIAAVYVSISIAVIATIISTVLGTITAIGLSRSRKILREWLLNVNNMPIMNPDIVTAIGLMILFTSMRLERGYLTMLLAHIAFCTPYVITSVYPKVRSMDHNLANVAMDLGATPFQALTKVIIPMLKPGIFAGMLLAFTMSLDDFVVSYFVTGNGVSNISIVVYNMTKRTNPTINALSTLLILVVVLILVGVNVIPALAKKRHKKVEMSASHNSPLKKIGQLLEFWQWQYFVGQDFQPLAVSRFFVCIIQGNIWILLLLRISKKSITARLYMKHLILTKQCIQSFKVGQNMM